MATKNRVYDIDQEIADFFAQTTATLSACNDFAREHVGGEVVPVTVQGVCSYTVYAGPHAEFVVQFRLKSLRLNMETSDLVRTIYGSFAPHVSFVGQIGNDDDDAKETLYIYVMDRVRGISYLDFILAHTSSLSENSPEFSSWRRNLMTDIARQVYFGTTATINCSWSISARFFALSWKNPQEVDQSYRDGLLDRYRGELTLLLTALPSRFHPFIQRSLDSLPAIFSLPMVLLHKDFGACNILVNESTCNLVGVVDWAEAEIAPFGLNLHSHQRLISQVHLKQGWSRFDDYALSEEIFWSTFAEQAGKLEKETIETIKAARIVGLLMSRGFTSRLANMPDPVPIRDDESGAYNMRELDGLLIKPATRFIDID